MHILATLCSNDAKSCYNWTILLVAALCLCRLGTPLLVVVSMTSTLAQLWYHVHSAFGNSELAQGQAEWKDPIAGIGQGNGTGPQKWVVVSTLLFEIL